MHRRDCRQGNRIVIVEAKGGKSYVNPASKWAAGRKVVINNSEEVFAAQGTRQYVNEIARLMSQSEDILDKLQAGQVDYYVTVARWAGKRGFGVGARGIVQKAGRLVRVFKAALD